MQEITKNLLSIRKYCVPEDKFLFELSLQTDKPILKVAELNGRTFFWAFHEENSPLINRVFLAIGTNQDFSQERIMYIGSVIIPRTNAPLDVHYFEIIEPMNLTVNKNIF